MQHSSKESAHKYIKNNYVAVIATCDNECNPASATIYYYVDDQMQIYFASRPETRKSKNIKQNGKVSLVVGTADEPVSIQIYGVGEEVTESGQKTEIIARLMSTAHSHNNHWPPVVVMKGGPIELFKITPKWARIYDARGMTQNSPDANVSEALFKQILPEPEVEMVESELFKRDDEDVPQIPAPEIPEQE